MKAGFALLGDLVQTEYTVHICYLNTRLNNLLLKHVVAGFRGVTLG